MTTPLVSVVIPTFNHAPLLKIALQSVIAQTFTNWEAIVVNNFSTDATVEVVESLNDSRLKLINFSNNGVIAASRNVGIKMATASYIAFLDSDDIWYPEKLQKCSEQIFAGYNFVNHGELWINEDGSKREVMYGPVSQAEYSKLLYRGNCISTSATVIEKSLIENVGSFDEDPALITTEDYDLWMRIAAMNPKICFIPEILGQFNRREGSASSGVIKHLASELKVLNKHFLTQPKTLLNRTRMRHRISIAHYGAARQLTGKSYQSLKLFARAWVLSPFLLKIYPAVVIALVKPAFKNERTKS